MADVKISGLISTAPAAALTGTEGFELVQGGVSKGGTASQIATYVRGRFTTTPATIAEGGTGASSAAAARANLGALGASPNDGFDYVAFNGGLGRRFLTMAPISGYWYPPDIGLTLGAGGAGILNTIYYSLLVLYRDTTVTDLGARVTTLIAASNFQLAIYAMNAAGEPTGSALAATSSMSGATATAVSSTLGAPVALPAGLYWAAVNADTSGIAFATKQNTQGSVAGFVGGAALSDVASASNIYDYHYTQAQTFGTWPAAGSLTKVTATAQNRQAALFYKVQ